MTRLIAAEHLSFEGAEEIHLTIPGIVKDDTEEADLHGWMSKAVTNFLSDKKPLPNECYTDDGNFVIVFDGEKGEPGKHETASFFGAMLAFKFML